MLYYQIFDRMSEDGTEEWEIDEHIDHLIKIGYVVDDKKNKLLKWNLNL